MVHQTALQPPTPDPSRGTAPVLPPRGCEVTVPLPQGVRKVPKGSTHLPFHLARRPSDACVPGVTSQESRRLQVARAERSLRLPRALVTCVLCPRERPGTRDAAGTVPRCSASAPVGSSSELALEPTPVSPVLPLSHPDPKPKAAVTPLSRGGSSGPLSLAQTGLGTLQRLHPVVLRFHNACSHCPKFPRPGPCGSQPLPPSRPRAPSSGPPDTVPPEPTEPLPGPRTPGMALLPAQAALPPTLCKPVRSLLQRTGAQWSALGWS